MAYAIDFPDSELRDVAQEGALVRLRLSAAAARNDAGERGWLSSVTLEISHASLQSNSPHRFGKIREAWLGQGGQRISQLQVPGTLTGDISLALRLANDTRIIIGQGTALEALLDADVRFQEDFSC